MKEIEDLQKAISLVEQAAGILKKSQMAFDFSIGNHGHDHHVAYTRTNASGTVSNIQAKGSQTPQSEIGRVSHENYRWGRLTKVEGKGVKAILHPEHQQAVGDLQDGESTSFKDEQGINWKATRAGENVHLQPPSVHSTKGLTARHADLAPEGTKTALPDDVNDAHAHASITSSDAWEQDKENAYSNPEDKNSEAVRAGHDKAEAALVHKEEPITDNIMDPPDDGTLMSEKEYNKLPKAPTPRPTIAELNHQKTQNELKTQRNMMDPTSRPASRVTVKHMEHLMAHGHDPRGSGRWMFSRHRVIDFNKHKEGEDYMKTSHLPYAEAKKQAKEWAGSKGHSLIWTMP